MRISEEHVAQWREHGYVVIPDFLKGDELAEAHENLARYMPTAEEYGAAPDRYRPVNTRGLMTENFPFAGDALNRICTHPDLIAFAQDALGTTDIALSHSVLVGKYAKAGDYDQQMHVDYHNNTLVYPKDDELIRDIPMILYYSDVTEDLGPTCVVSQTKTRGELLYPYWRSREEFPRLYEMETPVVATAGSILIYSMRTFHRGSAFRAIHGARFTHHIGYRAGAYRWLGQAAFQRDGGRPEMDDFLEGATPSQRELIGFPPVGHRYWDEETLAGVKARYPNMDLQPYEGVVGRST